MQSLFKNRSWIKISISVIAILLAVLCAVKIYDKAANKTENTGIIVKWDETIPDKSKTPEGIKIPGYPDIYFAANETSVNMTLCNPKDNKCKFKYSLYVDNDKQPIYKSDYIAPGYAIKSFDINKKLAKGEYSIKIKIEAFNLENGSKLNGAEVYSKLNVV